MVMGRRRFGCRVRVRGLLTPEEEKAGRGGSRDNLYSS